MDTGGSLGEAKDAPSEYRKSGKYFHDPLQLGQFDWMLIYARFAVCAKLSNGSALVDLFAVRNALGCRQRVS